MDDPNVSENAPVALLGPRKPTRPRSLDRKTISSREYHTIQNYIEGIKTGKKTSLRKSAIKAGYCAEYASKAARRIEELMTENQWVRAMMQEKGIGLESLVDDLAKIRKATCPPTKYDPNGEHPDFMVRQRNAEFRATLLDALPPKRMELEERSISIVVAVDTIEAIEAIKGPGFFRDKK